MFQITLFLIRTTCKHDYKRTMQKNLKIRPNFDQHDEIKKPEEVKELVMKFGESTQIFQGIGQFFINLEKLWIINSQIEVVSRSDFADLKQLKDLVLSENPIKFSTEDVFWDLEAMDRLDMNRCELKTLPENLFKNLKKLRDLDVGSNELMRLPKNLFADNLQLEAVNLIGNKLQKIEVDFTKFPNIKQIELRFNVCINEVFLTEKPEDSTISTTQELQAKINRSCIKNV